MKREQPVLIVLSIMMGASSVLADMISPSHTCPKPIKPSHFATQSEQANYDRQVRDYKQVCDGFKHLYSLEGGYVAWRDAELPLSEPSN